MRIWKCCKLNFLQWRIHPKYALCAFFLLLQMWNMFLGLDDYVDAIGYPLHPWLFALIPADYLHFFTLLLPFILIISDAPFRNRQQQFVLQRTGKLTWIAGQLLFLFLTCVIYTLVIWGLSLLLVLHCTQWGSDWGIAINTAAQTGAHFPYANIVLEYTVIKGATPIEATLWAFFTMILVFFIMGEIVILCNLWLKNGIGVMIVSGFALLCLILGYLRYMLPRELVWISPFSWLDRTMVGAANLNLPSYSYVICMTLGLCIMLGGIILGAIPRCNLDATKE